MKKKLVFISVVLLSIVLTVCSCAHKSGHKNDPNANVEDIAANITEEDVAYVKACLDKIQTEEFTDVDSFITWISSQREDWETDSIIGTMNTQTLDQIATIVYRKYNMITKQLIAKEYKESYNKVYKYMTPPIETYVPDSTRKEASDGE